MGFLLGGKGAKEGGDVSGISMEFTWIRILIGWSQSGCSVLQAMEVRPVPPPSLSTWVYSGGAKGEGVMCLEFRWNFTWVKNTHWLDPKGWMLGAASNWASPLPPHGLTQIELHFPFILPLARQGRKRERERTYGPMENIRKRVGIELHACMYRSDVELVVLGWSSSSYNLVDWPSQSEVFFNLFFFLNWVLGDGGEGEKVDWERDREDLLETN